VCVCVGVRSTCYVMCVIGRRAGSATGKCVVGDFLLCRIPATDWHRTCALFVVATHTHHFQVKALTFIK
jgi:hypothetical protein